VFADIFAILVSQFSEVKEKNFRYFHVVTFKPKIQLKNE